MFGREGSKQALKQSHEQVFREWLVMPLSEKAEDITTFIDGLEEERKAVLAHWNHAGHIQGLFPETASPAERGLFQQELDILVEVLKNAPAAEPRVQDSARRA